MFSMWERRAERCVTFGLLTTVTEDAFWDVTLCSLVNIHYSSRRHSTEGSDFQANVLFYSYFSLKRQFVWLSIFVKLFDLFLIYVAALSLGTGCVIWNVRMSSEQWIGKCEKESESGLIWDNVYDFSWWCWRKLRKILFRIVGLRVCIWTRNPQDAKYQC
jgi:hypothetical protein